MRVGIVGAGISGLVCAKRLLELAAPKQQLQVTTLEWGRGPGGRTARRRVKISCPPIEKSCSSSGNDSNSGSKQPPREQSKLVEASFDHAAPFFSARTKRFREGLLKEWEDQGLATKWTTNSASEDLWVGLPTNHAIAKGIVQDIESSSGSCLFGKHVQTAKYDETKNVWNVGVVDRNDSNKAVIQHTFDALVLSDKLLVLPNTYAILDPVDWKTLAIPSDLGSTGAVVLLVAFEKTTTSVTEKTKLFQAGVWHMEDKHPFLKTIVHDSAKPGRDDNNGLDLWVIHSTHEYAASHLVGERLDDSEAVRKELLTAFLKVLSKEASLTIPEFESKLMHSSVMAWDHAQPQESKRLQTSHLFDADRKAGVCGDFFMAETATAVVPGADENNKSEEDSPLQHLPPSGVEAAALSGLALAEELSPLLA